MAVDLAAALVAAGLDDGTPVAVAVALSGNITEACAGRWPDGAPVSPTDRFYLASLAKQLTGAAAALLVRDGRLDPQSPVSDYFADLPGWAATITVAHLAHHTAGLPEAGGLEDTVRSGHWTTGHVLDLLRRMSDLSHPPGGAYLYSNAGYILLAQIVARISGVDFPTSVTDRMLRPHGLDAMRYLTEPDASYPQLALMGPVLPLSVGDGGLWSSAGDFARWLDLMNRDAFGIADIVTAPGRLADGAPVDYGWGVGLRHRAGKPLYLHGGSWTGVTARALRMPDPGIGVVALVAGERNDDLTTLVDNLLDDIIGPRRSAG